MISMPGVLSHLYLVRHGETAWSLSGQHTGRTDIPLTEQGNQDARKLAQRLRPVRFTRMFTSPLQRARRTCDLAGLGEVAEIDSDLTEWDYGEYEGRRSFAYSQDLESGRWEATSPSTRTAISGATVAARWIGLPVRQAHRFLLSTVSLSVLGYEHTLAGESAIVLWNAASNDIST